MRRQEFIRLIGGAAAAWPLRARAQSVSRTARVAVLASGTEANFEPSIAVFRDALGKADWVEGQNLTLDVRYGGDHYERLSALMAELLALTPDVIVSLGTPATEAAKRATRAIPIVMESLSDAVASGIVANLARPGGNVTGVSGFAPELNGKRLELIREIRPGANRIAILANLANRATAPVIRTTESAAQRMRTPSRRSRSSLTRDGVSTTPKTLCAFTLFASVKLG
jgi:putative tryptophan/tyrosine transport system substrate-binding protein